MSADPGTDAAAAEALLGYVREARWFGGKGREVVVDGVRRIAEVEAIGDGRASIVVLVDLTYPDTGEQETYQVPLVLTEEPDRELDDGFVGWWDEPGVGWRHAYDAVRDPRSMATWLRRFARADELPGRPGEMAFRRLPGHELDVDATPWLFSGEQSNSSVFFGEDALLKVFRKVTPGPNPDITTHEVLTAAGSEHVAALYGWLETTEPDRAGGEAGEVLHLGMLQQFLRTATDGWEVALASVRNLFSEADLHADEVGGDFAGESERLGEALADVHAQLREAFGVESSPGTTVAAQMNGRLDEALVVVPDLAEHEQALRGAYAAVADLAEVPTQRIHADLHLGQTLRTVYGWKLVDFEGEPARPLHERLRPDSPWRDVAGMLRSFDYAPHAVARAVPEHDPDVVAQRARRIEEWAARNKAAFLAGYAVRTTGEPGLEPHDGALVAAYVADKAVYECVYEARNRPAWLPIPLTAVARIGVR